MQKISTKLLGWLLVCMSMQHAIADNASPTALPISVQMALDKAGIASDAISVVVVPAMGVQPTLEVAAERAMSPASTMKLVTTLVALDELGPNFTWKTQFLTSSEQKSDVLPGDLYLRGGGEPNLTWDKLQMMLRALRNQGIRKIRGDIVLDRHYFLPNRPDLIAPEFDEYANAYYNVIPDALLINSNIIGFNIQSSANKVQVKSTLPLADVAIDNTFILDNRNCADWENRWNTPLVNDDKEKSLRINLSGSFPRHCNITTYLNVLDRNVYIEHLIRALWTELGGVWDGNVRDGETPADARGLSVHTSETLGDIVKITNKFSDNSMARILFLTLGAESPFANTYPDHLHAAQARIAAWLARHNINGQSIVLENGSGLSRVEQITAQQLAAVLIAGYRSPWYPEYASSLPIAALDGSMKRRLKGKFSDGQARIKTGTLKNVVAVAGYVRDINENTWIIVGIINGENAKKGRPALDELINWVAGGQAQQ